MAQIPARLEAMFTQRRLAALPNATIIPNLHNERSGMHRLSQLQGMIRDE
jgi:hypothetical protein